MGKSGNPAKRAEQDRAPEYDPTPVDAEGVEDFDAFWQAQDRAITRVRIMGETVELPASLPLQFELEADRLSGSQDTDDLRYLVGILFGQDALDKWAKAGMDRQQFAVLLAWAPQRIEGGNMSLAEVAAKVAEAEGGDRPGEA